MDGRYNTKSPAVKRLMREAQELSEPTDQYFAQPLDDNLFEWHFTVRGPADSDFQNGIYHGRIVLPVDYPMKPPSIIWLTPNGRFETNKKICLSISGHHPESWQPSWSIRTALLAIIGFMPTHPGGAIGSLDYKPEERKHLAKKSKEWKCATCGQVNGILLEVSENSEGTSKESKELAAQINLQGEKPKCKEGECPVEQARVAEIQAQASSNAASSPGQTNPPSTDQKGESNNASFSNSGNQQELPESSPSSPSSIPQPASFPPWSPAMVPFPMPPMGFPFQYPGAMLPNMMPPNMMPPLPPMQFPYPPSHAAASMPLAGWPAMHPGMGGIFPGSFPLPSMPPPPASLFPGQPAFPNSNSSPAHGDNQPCRDSSNNSDNQSPTSKQYTRSPMVVPLGAAAGETAASSQAGTSQDQGQEDLFKELLSKVKRLGSDVKMTEASSVMGAAKGVEAKSETEALGNPTPKDVTADGGAESEMSKSLKDTATISVSEHGDTNTEDNSEVDAPPIEGSEDARPVLEKNACSSTSELDKCKQKPQNNKGLRHRQSVTTSVPTEVSDETVAESERPDVSALRQRIEAASGDTSLRNRSRLGVRLGVHQNVANDMMNNVQPVLVLNRGTDILLYIMVCLLATTMMILVNRLASMDWN